MGRSASARRPSGCAKGACRTCRSSPPVAAAWSAPCGCGTCRQGRAGPRCCSARSRWRPTVASAASARRSCSAALREARRLGHGAVLLVGDAPYYGRFGFSNEKTGSVTAARALRAAPAARAASSSPARSTARADLISATGRRGPKPDLATPLRPRRRRGDARARAQRDPVTLASGAVEMNAPTSVTEGRPLHARFDGPIVMIGFGSIGKGTLPLIERHIAFDRSKFVVIAPDDRDRSLLDERQIRFIHQALTKDNYREILTPLLTAGPGRGMVVNLSVDTSSVDLMELCQGSRRLLHRHRRRAVAGPLHRPQPFDLGALELCAARERARSAPAAPRRHHRRELLRRQSRHGVVDGEAGAGRHRRRAQARLRRAAIARGLGAADAARRRQGHPHRRARHPAGARSQAEGQVRQYLVGRRLHLRGPAAVRARLGHA